MQMNELAELPLLNQFVISLNPQLGYEREFHIGDWFIGHASKFSVSNIFDAKGELIGAFLGSVIDLGSAALEPASITIPWERGLPTFQLEECLYEFLGPWIAIIVTAEMQAVYLDACGSLPLVYCADQKMAGSSASALLNDQRYFELLYGEAKSETWFRADWYHTAGLTAHHLISRLLPNHKLDLGKWSVERIWPLHPIPVLPVERVVAEVSKIAKESIRCAMQGARALVPLTAGNETRAILSLIREQRESALFFTGSFPGAAVDLGVARRLAERFHLKHVITHVEMRSPSDVQVWRRRTGHCVGGAIGFFKMNRQNVSETQLEFSGAAGEVGRGFLWSSTDTASDRLTSNVLLARLKLPAIPRFLAAVEIWLQSVSQFDAFTVMDLAYLELKMACWAGPQATGAESQTAQIWPFSSRRSFAAMMSAPPRVRLEQTLFQKIVESEWPELLDIPINKGTPWEHTCNLIHRASSPHRIWGKLRKRFAKIKPGRNSDG